MRELISALKEIAGGVLIVQPSPKILASEEKVTILKFLLSDFAYGQCSHHCFSVAAFVVVAF